MSADTISQREVDFLHAAADYLENPSYLIRLGNTLGKPVQELARRVLPEKVASVAEAALRRAMGLAIITIPGDQDDEREFREAHDSANWTGFWHKMSTVATGFGGGLFGLSGLAIELPITTGILFRSIAAVAGELGEDLREPAVRLECLSVFSQGGPGDDVLESSYLATRLAVAQLIEEAARFVSRETAQAVAEAMARGSTRSSSTSSPAWPPASTSRCRRSSWPRACHCSAASAGRSSTPLLPSTSTPSPAIISASASWNGSTAGSLSRPPTAPSGGA